MDAAVVAAPVVLSPAPPFVLSRSAPFVLSLSKDRTALRAGSSKDRRRGPSGITLMEILLASALLSLVAMGAFAIYGSSQTYLRDAVTQSRLQADAGFVLRHLTRNVRRGSAVAWVAPVLPDMPEGGLEITVPTNATPITMRYWRDAAQQLRWDDDLAVSGGEQTLVGQVTGFTVTDVSGAALSSASSVVRITLTSGAGGQTVTLTTTTTVRGRQN